MDTVTTQQRFAIDFSRSRVDAESGVIYGVAVITAGPLRKGDKRKFKVDSTTLSQVAALGSAHAHGLKVKMTHDGEAGDIAGALHDFRVDGPVTRADLHLLKNYPQRAYLLEMAEKMPGEFGLSIDAAVWTETVGADQFLRCRELSSCDIVDTPAANRGLFDVQRPIEKPHTNMDDSIKQEIAGIVAEQLKPITERLSKFEKETPDAKALQEQFTAKLNEAVTLAAAKASEETVKLALSKLQLGTAPGAAAAPSAPAAPAPEKFEDVVAKLKAEGKKHNEALSFAMDKHSDLYAAYLKRAQSGEIIRL